MTKNLNQIMKKPLTIINFGPLLSDAFKRQIEEELGRPVLERRIRLQLDHKKLTYPQVMRAVDRIDFTGLPNDALLNLPTDSAATACLISEFFARTGQHPNIIERVKWRGDPVWRFGTKRNLEFEIQQTRKRRSTKVVNWAKKDMKSPPQENPLITETRSTS